MGYLSIQFLYTLKLLGRYKNIEILQYFMNIFKRSLIRIRASFSSFLLYSRYNSASRHSISACWVAKIRHTFDLEEKKNQNNFMNNRTTHNHHVLQFTGTRCLTGKTGKPPWVMSDRHMYVCFPLLYLVIDSTIIIKSI